MRGGAFCMPCTGALRGEPDAVGSSWTLRASWVICCCVVRRRWNSENPASWIGPINRGPNHIAIAACSSDRPRLEEYPVNGQVAAVPEKEDGREIWRCIACPLRDSWQNQFEGRVVRIVHPSTKDAVLNVQGSLAGDHLLVRDNRIPHTSHPARSSHCVFST